jgi:ATP-dependent DNA helicase RecG
MTLNSDDLLHAVRQGRTERLDWLNEGAALESIAVVLTALANSQGGVLVIGVAGTKASLSGVREPEAVQDRVLQAALAIDPPLIIALPRVVRAQEMGFVVVDVPRGLPHVYAYDGRFLVRQGLENVALKPRELRRLLMERGEASYELEIAYGAAMDDIDWEKARAYAAMLSSVTESNVERLLLRRGCVAQHEGRLRPTHAGILLFGKEPQRFVRGAQVIAARFAGDAMSDRFDRQELVGTLPDQLRRAETFLRDHLRKVAHLGGTMARDEQYEYPLEAARELVVNAVAHRDYSIAGDEIRLFIFRDHMEVVSPGRLPGPVTLDNIRDERFSRNPVIVQVLSDMGFIERLGYGVDRVIALMEQRKLRLPEFEEISGGFRAALYNQIDVVEEAAAVPAVVASDVLSHYRNMPFNPRQEAALVYLHTGNTRITNSYLQQLFPDVHPETIRRDLSDLVLRNILQKLGEKRGSYYVLREEETASGE